MEVDKYFKSSVQWLDVILKAVEERDKRHKWHDTSSALYKLYPKADDVCQVMKASAEQLNTILTSSSSDEARTVARHLVILMWWLENYENYYHTQRNDLVNSITTINKVLMGPFTIAARWISSSLYNLSEFKKLSKWFNDQLKDDLIAFSRGHALNNLSDFLRIVRVFQNKLKDTASHVFNGS